MAESEDTVSGAEQTRHGEPRIDALQDAEVSVVRRRLLVSAAFLAVQVAATDYGLGVEAGSAAVVWFVVGAALLWLVYRRRSRTARGVVVVLALTGAVVYALNAFGNRDGHAAVLAVAYVGQAVPLLTHPVRRHVQSRR